MQCIYLFFIVACLHLFFSTMGHNCSLISDITQKANLKQYNCTVFPLPADHHSPGGGLHRPEDAAGLPAATDRCRRGKQSH